MNQKEIVISMDVLGVQREVQYREHIQKLYLVRY